MEFATNYTAIPHTSPKHVASLSTKANLTRTPWNRVLLEQHTGFQLVKKFPAFCGTRSFIAAFIILTCVQAPRLWKKTFNTLHHHIAFIARRKTTLLSCIFLQFILSLSSFPFFSFVISLFFGFFSASFLYSILDIPLEFPFLFGMTDSRLHAEQQGERFIFLKGWKILLSPTKFCAPCGVRGLMWKRSEVKWSEVKWSEVKCREGGKNETLWEKFIWVVKWWEVKGWGESVIKLCVGKHTGNCIQYFLTVGLFTFDTRFILRCIVYCC